MPRSWLSKSSVGEIPIDFRCLTAHRDGFTSSMNSLPARLLGLWIHTRTSSS